MLSSLLTIPVLLGENNPISISSLKIEEKNEIKTKPYVMTPIVLEGIDSQLVRCFPWKNLSLDNCPELYSIGSCIYFGQNGKGGHQIDCNLRFWISENQWITTLRTIAPLETIFLDKTFSNNVQNISISSRTHPGTLLPIKIPNDFALNCYPSESFVKFIDGDFILSEKSLSKNVEIYCKGKNRQIYK